MSRIWLSPPEVVGGDRDRLLAAVDGGWIAPVGADLDAFEAEVAAVCGRGHGVGLASGTAALHLVLKELGVAAGDDVLVSTFTFAASANAVCYLGARPVFIDAEASTWQMSPDLLAAELDERRRAGRAMPRAAVVVDLYGQCADYARICPVLAEHGVPLVEDAAEALGATYRGQPAGSFGAAAIVSFNGNKIITTSGGGMAVTDDPELARRCRHLATQARAPGVAHYEHEEVGYNYRLSNLLAAFGRGQLDDLERRVGRRREINERYRAALADLEGVAFMPEADDGVSTCWLTCLTIDPGRTTPERVRTVLEADEIETRPTWKPMHLQPVFRDAPARIDGTSDHLYETGLCLPSGSGLTHDDQDRVVQRLRSALGA